MRKIIFSHRRAVGDCLMFTCGVRDFKLLLPEIEINVSTNFKELFLNNPYINPKIKKKEEGVEFYKVGYPIVNNANHANTHFTQAFLFDMLASADLHEKLPISIAEIMSAFGNGRVGDPDIEHELMKKYRGICKEFARQRPDIHLTNSELKGNVVRDMYDVEKYWVIAPGGKRDCTAKIWDWRRFQKVIDYFEGRIKFVVVGRSDHLIEPLRHTVDLTDKFTTNLRGIFSLVYHSEGVVSGVSFLMHLAAAVPPRIKHERKPCVSIYGGREPTTFTCYTNHQVLHTNGAFTCCDSGGCWQSRVVPIAKDSDKNKRMCHHTVVRDSRTMQKCMDTIRADDIIRGIEKYYEGNLYKYLKPKEKKRAEVIELKRRPISYKVDPTTREINFLASLKSKGGGEQSAVYIVELLRKAGWTVHFYPWEKVHENYDRSDCGIRSESFKDGMLGIMKPGLPLFFYANDQIWDFVEHAGPVVDKSASLAVGINFANGTLPTCKWGDKLKAIVFQNDEKRVEFDRDAIGLEGAKRVVLFGAIKLDQFLDVYCKGREKDEDFVVLKHGLPDWRKYITKQSEGTGDKIHIWQKHFIKENDFKFYERLIKDVRHIRFMFMEAHPDIVKEFRHDDRMTFYKFNEIPVTEFLSRGHVYLHRMSNKWRDQYPRVVAEALAAGLPILSEPRDGTKDRIEHGNTGFYCTHYDEFKLALATLKRKEKLRSAMGQRAKDWARTNLDPRRWIDTLEEVFYNGNGGTAVSSPIERDTPFVHPWQELQDR